MSLKRNQKVIRVCVVGTLDQSLQKPNAVRQNLPYSTIKSNFLQEPKA